jgi:hypothetical protein
MKDCASLSDLCEELELEKRVGDLESRILPAEQRRERDRQGEQSSSER